MACPAPHPRSNPDTMALASGEENSKAQASLPGAGQGPDLLKIGLPLEWARFEKRGPGRSTLYHMVNISVTLDVFGPPAILKSCESVLCKHDSKAEATQLHIVEILRICNVIKI